MGGIVRTRGCARDRGTARALGGGSGGAGNRGGGDDTHLASEDKGAALDPMARVRWIAVVMVACVQRLQELK